MCRDSDSDENRSDREVVHATEHGGSSLTETIIEAVAVVADDDPASVEPLYESVNPDALEHLFDRPVNGSVPRRVEFNHEGYTVAVMDHGRRIEIRA